MKSHESQEKQAAMDLAEESREAQWTHPSFVAGLFRGDVLWDLIMPFPEQDPEDKRIGDEYIEKVRALLEQYVDPEAVDREQTVPPEALKALADIGCFGMKIPKEYGGLGFSQTNYTRVVSFIGSYCASTSVYVSSHLSIGVPQPIRMFGTEAQKKKFLPRLAAGELSAFALTEPDVGSDPARVKTTATPSADGSYYLLNGEKLWCTNGPVAKLLVVMAVTPPKIVNGKEKKQITAFVVETDSPGFEVVHVCRFMGVRGIRNGLLRFNNVKVPAENVIGKPGDGLRIAFTTLNTGRLTMPATSAAGGRLALHHVRGWVNERVQWGAPIWRHQAVGKKLAHMASHTFAMDSMSSLGCMLAERGGADIRLEAAMAKYFCTETAWKIVDDMLQVRGGRGYETAASLRKRGEKPLAVEMSMRNARISRIVEGTSEIMQLFIAREAMDTHMSRILPIVMPKPGQKESRFALAAKALRFYIPWYVKTWLPAGGPDGVRYLNEVNRGHAQYIGKTSRRLARTMFHTMAKYQQKLEYEQLILAAFVDIGTDLFAMAASLARAEKLLEQNPKDEDLQLLVDHFCRSARERIRANFRHVKRNFNRLINKVAKSYAEGKYEWIVRDVYTGVPTHFDAVAEALEAVHVQPHEEIAVPK